MSSRDLDRAFIRGYRALVLAQLEALPPPGPKPPGMTAMGWRRIRHQEALLWGGLGWVSATTLARRMAVQPRTVARDLKAIQRVLVTPYHLGDDWHAYWYQQRDRLAFRRCGRTATAERL
jgi:hypothetical protein